MNYREKEIDEAIKLLEEIRIDINLKPNREGIDEKASDLNMLLFKLYELEPIPPISEGEIHDLVVEMWEAYGNNPEFHIELTKAINLINKEK
jgi:hypothetical protein